MSMAEAQKESERKGVASFKGGAEAVGASEQEQVVMTINTPMRKIVRVEKIDKAGKRHEIPEEEWAKLVGEDELEDIQVALEEAFEAGIAAVLGEEYEDDEADEDDDERALRRFLIRELQRRRPVQRRILQRVLVSRLLRRQFLESPLRK
jgi:hypothetical protein